MDCSSGECGRHQDLLNSVEPFSLRLPSHAELNILPDAEGFWAAIKGRKVEEHLAWPLTALDEAKLRPHGNDLQHSIDIA